MRSLAEQLGIHVSTVSRVLNGTEAEARSAASPEVIERICSIAMPVRIARQLPFTTPHPPGT
nr:helix-turn-helix domain-containing protein [Candidimonas sp. SYP-B2681]